MLTKLTKFWAYAVLAILITACVEQPEVEFVEPIKGRTINLANKMGDSFTVTDGKDTATYYLTYDRETKYNYLIRDKKDTTFVGTVTKRNELYLLNRKLKNGKYAIHALKFTDSTVVGIETEWAQSYFIDTLLKQGLFTELIVSNEDVTSLYANKKQGRELFRTVLSKCPVLHLIDMPVAKKQDSLKNATPKQEPQLPISEETKLVRKVYPNPFTDNITIEMLEAAPYAYQLYDLNGRLIKTSKLMTSKMQMNFPELQPGTYILKVSTEKMEKIEEIRLIRK